MLRGHNWIRRAKISRKTPKREEDEHRDFITNNEGDLKTNITCTQPRDPSEVGTVGRNDEETSEELTEDEVCPECGAPLAYIPTSDNKMGVGQTYDPVRMNPFTIFYDVACSKCGLVVGHSTHEVHR